MHAITSAWRELTTDPARLKWRREACLPKPRRSQVTNVAHYYLAVDAMTQPMMVREHSPLYGARRA